MSRLIDAYNEGAEAYVAGDLLGQCPYSTVSPEGEAWIEGYKEQRSLRLSEMINEEIYDMGYQAGFLAGSKNKVLDK